jgi:hypothetical protein
MLTGWLQRRCSGISEQEKKQRRLRFIEDGVEMPTSG